MSALMTTADLPAALIADSVAVAAKPAPTLTLTCPHGVACPPCVLAAARLMVSEDATLTGSVYTG